MNQPLQFVIIASPRKSGGLRRSKDVRDRRGLLYLDCAHDLRISHVLVVFCDIRFIGIFRRTGSVMEFEEHGCRKRRAGMSDGQQADANPGCRESGAGRHPVE